MNNIQHPPLASHNLDLFLIWTASNSKESKWTNQHVEIMCQIRIHCVVHVRLIGSKSSNNITLAINNTLQRTKASQRTIHWVNFTLYWLFVPDGKQLYPSSFSTIYKVGSLLPKSSVALLCCTPFPALSMKFHNFLGNGKLMCRPGIAFIPEN